MVGRPGRSKGCITCRRRKVKCDEQKPKCHRCRDAYMICEGYRNTNFINESPHPRGLGSHASPSPTQSNGNVESTTQQFSLICPSSLNLSAFQENVWITYTTAKLFPGSGYTGSETPASRSQSWVLDFIEADTTSVAYLAACCLSAAFFARTHGMGSTDLQSGIAYYTKALKQLVLNLSNPNISVDPSNVAAAVLLGIDELSMSNAAQGWIHHAGGVGKLIEMRGPSAHLNGLAKRYFMISRFPIIAQAFCTRRRCFLENEPWLSHHFCGDHTLFQQLLDIFSRIPGLLEEHDFLSNKSTADNKPAQGKEVEAHSRALINTVTRLFVWRWKWETLYPDMAYEIPLHQSTSLLSVDDKVIPIYDNVIFYRNFHLSRGPTLYSAALLILLHLTSSQGIADAPAQALSTLTDVPRPAQSNPLLLPSENLSIAATAREICRSVEFHLQGSHLMTGALMVLLPLRVVADFVEDERERRWLARVTRKMATEHGFLISERLTNCSI